MSTFEIIELEKKLEDLRVLHNKEGLSINTALAFL